MGSNQVNSAANPRRAWLLVLIAAVSLLAGAVWVIGDYGGKLRLSPASQTVRREQATGRPEFPRTATDASGAELILPAPPQRIASQALATDHFLFALVPYERIVAVSQFATDSSYSNIAGIVRQLPVEVASDTESVLRVSPDLFLTSHRARADHVELLRAAGIPVFRVRTVYENLEQIKQAFRLVGYMTGEDEAATARVAWLDEQVRAARSLRPAGARKLRVLVLTAFFYSYGKGSLLGDMIEKLGEINVGSMQGLSSYAKIGSEQVAAWNPDWIISGANPGDEKALRRRLLGDAGVAATTAGKTGQVLVVENRFFASMSHHAVHLMRRLAEELYPENPEERGLPRLGSEHGANH